MSHWNYRAIRKTCPKTGEVYFQIHEVHYNKAGEITGVSTTPSIPQGSDEKELQSDLSLLNLALDKPALVLKDIVWGEKENVNDTL